MVAVERIGLEGHVNVEERGWGVNLSEVMSLLEDRLVHLHVVSMKPGTARGNHYHPQATEWLLVCGGPVKLLWCADDGETTHEILLDGTGPALLRIPPGVRHALDNQSDVEVYLVVLADAQDPATTRCPPLMAPLSHNDPR